MLVLPGSCVEGVLLFLCRAALRSGPSFGFHGPLACSTPRYLTVQGGKSAAGHMGLAAHRRTHLPKRVLLYRLSSSLASGTSLAFWRYSTPLAMSTGTPRPLQYIFPKR